MSVPMLQDPSFGFASQSSAKQAAAACKLLDLAQVTHKRPPWLIDSVVDKGQSVPVVEEVVMTRSDSGLYKDAVRFSNGAEVTLVGSHPA